MTIKQVPAHTNNYDKGRAGKTIKKVVMHWIVGTLSSADATFQSPTRKASAHYGVGPKEVHQYVNEADTAWHAGNYGVNQESIGIEHEGGPDLPIQEGTYKNSAELLAGICKRHNIPLDRTHVVLHREIKATQCPGTLDVDRIIKMAISLSSATLEPKPITDPSVKIDFQGLQTSQEVYDILEVQQIRSKFEAKDRHNTELEKQVEALEKEIAVYSTTPTPTDPLNDTTGSDTIDNSLPPLPENLMSDLFAWVGAWLRRIFHAKNAKKD